MTAPPEQAILNLPRGATWVVRWPVTDPTSGDAVDLSTWEAAGQVRAWYGSAEVLAVLDVTAGADGYVVCQFDAEVTAAWEFDRGVYGIELTNPAGDRIPVAIGPILLSPEVVT